jgi:ATPase involved in DNA repair
MRSASQADQYRIDRLREQLLLIEKLNPQPGEIESLAQQIERLSNVESLREAALKSHDSLSSEDQLAASELVGISRKALESQSDPVLQDLYKRLTEIGALVSEVAIDLSSFLAALEADPEKLNQLLSRRAELISLERALGKEIEELLESLPSMHAELLDLDSSDEQMEKLEMQLEATLSQLSAAASVLTQCRLRAASEVSTRVSAELTQLAMSGSSFEVKITPLADFEQSGIDRVEFYLRLTPEPSRDHFQKGPPVENSLESCWRWSLFWHPRTLFRR